MDEKEEYAETTFAVEKDGCKQKKLSTSSAAMAQEPAIFGGSARPESYALASPSHRAKDAYAIQGYPPPSTKPECVRKPLTRKRLQAHEATDETCEEKDDAASDVGLGVTVTFTGLMKRLRAHQERHQLASQLPAHAERPAQLTQPRASLPGFEETPSSTIGQAVSNIIDHINPCAAGCCSFHIAVASVSAVLKVMKKQSCLSDFPPCREWQCTLCYFMQSDDVDAFGCEDIEGSFCWHCGNEKS